MVKSTNQVTQFFVVEKSAVLKTIKDPSGAVVTGYQVVVDDRDTTDVIPAKHVLGVNKVLATANSEKLFRKVLKVKLSANVNGGAPVAGQDYIISLKFRGLIGEEDTIEKVAMAHATASDTAATLLQKLAKSFIDNASVEESPLYEVMTTAGVALSDDVSTITEEGFVIVEAKPYWRMGTFIEALAKIDVSTRPIILSGDEEDKWLDSYKFVADKEGTYSTAIMNTHRVADMEYFYKGERGVSAGLNAPYDLQIPLDLRVDAGHAAGYDILTIHYAYVGANASNQKSEKDIVLVCKSGAGFLNTIETELKKLL